MNIIVKEYKSIPDEVHDKPSSIMSLRNYLERCLHSTYYDESLSECLNGKLDVLVEYHINLVELLVKKGVLDVSDLMSVLPKLSIHNHYKIVIES